MLETLPRSKIIFATHPPGLLPGTHFKPHAPPAHTSGVVAGSVAKNSEPYQMLSQHWSRRLYYLWPKYFLQHYPELSVSFATKKGEVIVSGCSHTTIETIVQETKKVRKGKVHLVVGGYHLIPYKRDYIEGLARRMKEEYGVESVAPAHCSGHLGFSIFQKAFGDKYRFFGLGERITHFFQHVTFTRCPAITL